MDSSTKLRLGRRKAQSRMSETVTAGLTKSVTDPATGKPTVVYTRVDYSGIARVKFASSVVSNSVSGGQLVAAQNVELHCPAGTKIPINDIVTVTASTVDAGLIGRVFKVTGRPDAGQATAARFPVVEQ